jgi:hypothetical protein
MKTNVFNLIILDASGSMMTIKQSAIDSVNETLQTIRAAQSKHADQQHFVTLVTFNDVVKTISECAPAEEVAELTTDTYLPCCCTALYDAMGQSLTTLRPHVAEADRVLVTIVTDGYENASREYSGQAVKALVDELKAKGWVFAYMGANQDVEAVAATMSITNAMKFEANDHGYRKMSKKVNACRDRLYESIACCSFNMEEANKDFFADDDEEQ